MTQFSIQWILSLNRGLHPKTETRKIGTLFSEWRCSLKSNKKRERRTAKFKERAVQRIVAGEAVAGLSRELGVRRSLLYRWRDAFRKEGIPGFRPIGRPGWSEQKQAEAAEARISELERKIGHQTMVIDFLRRAFKRVEELRRPNKGNGGTASIQRSRP
jgi:transposase-like protein